MSDGASLIKLDLGDASKPANTLIEKISDAIGVLYEPNRIERKARAEAKAEQIKELTNIETQTLKYRAIQRFITEEARNQENIESIIGKTLPLLTAGSNPGNIDPDWINNFFDKSKLTGDNEMQLLWSKVLAEESNNPGKYSKRTVNFIASLDKKDALVFTKLCGFCINKNDPQPLIFNTDEKIYSDAGINFSVLKHFDSIGLISFESLAGYRFTGLSKILTIDYYGKVLQLELQKDLDNEVDVGKVLLTGVGKELASICNPEPIKGFEDYIIEYWKTLGIKVIS